MTNFSQSYLENSVEIIKKIPCEQIETIAANLSKVRSAGGRLFFLGVGGSAGNCGHAVNDFRKLCGFEAYAPTDNVSELTARTNDEGWDTVFTEWLKVSRLKSGDALFIFSVGGGNREKKISVNLTNAIDLAKEVGAEIFGVVGKETGYAAQSSSNVLVIPSVDPGQITPQSEAFQAVIWHLLVSHPTLKENQTKWESTK